ncbi:MAG: hypothetical protein VYC17_03565 [Nitrospinota bacterium]|nr:hypothetical protein [Nitrospinota bacterium]
MRISYSPQLMEEAVFRHLNHLERSGMRAEYDEFHSLADPIYELPEDDREEAFAKTNKIFFLENLGLGNYVIRALEGCGLIPKKRRGLKQSRVLASVAVEAGETGQGEEATQEGEPVQKGDPDFPRRFSRDADLDDADLDNKGAGLDEEEAEAALEQSEEEGDDLEYESSRQLEERIAEVVIKRAINKVDEGSNVLNRISNQKPSIEMRVLASRFANLDEESELEAFLIHEFYHARDMVDPEFDYEDSFIPGSPSVKNLITARFRVLWNIYVDSRLARKKIPSVMAREARFREFDNYYRKLPEKQRRGIFEGLWREERFTHEELLSMATDLETLMAKFVEYDEDFTEEDQEYIHLPGSPCPLCKFPTYNWVDDPESICDEMVIEAIQIDFPEWESKDGACDRCVEVYELRSGVG